MEIPIALEKRNKPLLKTEVAFIIVHLLPFAAIFTGATWFDWAMCAFFYFFRMFWITGGYHRYFSHNAYKTSRWFQFVIAFMAQTSAQKGALWWAAHHRHHHRHSDTPSDPHSMKLYGFWYSHVGWIVGPDYKETNFKTIGDFAKYPELVWLNKYYLVPPVVLALTIMALGGIVDGGSITMMFSSVGFSALFIGFFLSTVITYHGTFTINSIMHKFGDQRYETGDESKNSIWLALLTLGEGWHNNHHYYEVASRQGFFWWEVDITWYILKMFSWMGLIWDLKGVPDHIKFSKNKKQAQELKKQYELQRPPIGEKEKSKIEEEDVPVDFLESARKLFRYYKKLGEGAMAQLNDEEVLRQPNEASNSIALIVHHLSGNMLSRWTDFLTSDGEKPWRNREAEFEETYPDKKTLLEAWEKGWDCLLNTVDNLKPEDLSTIIYIRNEGQTVMEAIQRQLAHYPHHVGQILYQAKSIKGNAFKSLSIPKGGSDHFNKDKFSKEKERRHFTDRL